MVQVILISQFALPYSKIGSWTTLYHNYLQTNPTIDSIICEKPELELDLVQYGIVANTFSIKIRKRISKNPYVGYLKELEKMLQSNKKYIIQIVDNFGIVKPVHKLLLRKGLRENCHIQFFYHGFPPFYENFRGRWFFETIDEVVLLTHDSYKAYKEYYTILPCRFSVLYNGIDTSKFKRLPNEQKQILKNELDFKAEKIFIWCSKDLPKKGLDFILPIWKKIHERHKNTVLLVVGASRKFQMEGVQFLGKVPNNELPKYYQVSDCYLFPTLWHEGFGLSLIEALHSGCYCIASALGGVSEVLQYGKYGKLIQNPHFDSDWEDAILEFLNEPLVFETISTDLYSTESWNSGMNAIIANAKNRLE